MDAKIKINSLSKTYTDEAGFSKVLFDKISFELNAGGITSLLAPLGSGKSTLLKIIAGLEEATKGTITGNNNVIFVPGEYSIYPWLNVSENILFNLDEYDENKLKRLIRTVGLDGYEDHVPHLNSIGFIFRVALARSIMHMPDYILLDEPFELMKPEVRKQALVLVRKVSEEFEIPILLATKNISSAIFLADRVIIMKSNPSEIVATEQVVFDLPRAGELFEHDSFQHSRKKIEDIIDGQPEIFPHQFTI